MVLPYISRVSLLDQVGQRHTRSMRALLNIVCSHASSDMQTEDSETYYRRALALLDERTLRGSNVEMIQALLLLATFQQNHQRAVASWTYHAIAVKAAYQLGLHSPVSLDHGGREDKELRGRLWCAVVNQDRCLAIALGRPFLIPSHHVRPEPPRMFPVMSISALGDTPSVQYFNSLTMLYSLQSLIVESLYDHNIGTSGGMSLQATVIQRLQLLSKLDDWRRQSSPFFDILKTTELGTCSPPSYESNRFQILLSIQYYKTVLLINSAVLAVLVYGTSTGAPHESHNSLPLEYTMPVIREDFTAARNLDRIIHCITTRGGSFLDSNATWWTCNYTSFTAILHFFGIFLACRLPEYANSFPDSMLADTRSALDNALETLRAVERTSLMSQKARHCVEGFLQVYDAMTASRYQPAEESRIAQNDSGILRPAAMNEDGDDALSEALFSQFISQSADDFLFQCSNSSFLDADFSYL
ncbi:fungal-specific transcription factor domain-containing protein [Macrophomina phaseolina]|uniref:Fungal-specific transcription factor domain-containing protein n=1 Tax=Macrophomina phaseolina TaxID=35725 RepID=A0ABQ8FYD8_9PEZI|nr:fungal-specific transcription factor domain-containing protein [Macrophomina phaseolina]